MLLLLRIDHNRFGTDLCVFFYTFSFHVRIMLQIELCWFRVYAPQWQQRAFAYEKAAVCVVRRFCHSGKKKFKMKIKLCLLCDDRRDSLHTAAFCSPFKRKILLLFSSNQCAGSIRWDIVSDQLSRCDMTTNLGFLSSVDPFWSVAHSTIHRILRTYTFPFARASRDLLITQLIYWPGGRSLFSIAVSIPCDQQQQQQHIDPRNAVRNRVTVFLLLYFLCVYIAL